MNRTWHLQNESAGIGNYDLTFGWDAVEADAGLNTGSLLVAKYDSPTWETLTTNSSTSNSVSASYIGPTFSDFQIGEANCVTTAEYRSVVSGSWTDPATWEVNSSCGWIPATTAPFWDADVISIQNNTTVSIFGASFNLNAFLTIEAGSTLNIASAGVDFGDTADVQVHGLLAIGNQTTINTAANITIDGACTIDGQFTLYGNGSVVFGTTTFAIAPTINISGSGPIVFDNITFRNSLGTLTWIDNAVIDLVNYAVFQNDATFNWEGDGEFICDSGIGFVNNNGVLNKNGPGLASILGNIDFVSTNTINLNDGYFDFSANGGDVSGALNISSTAEWTGSSDVIMSGQLINDGIISSASGIGGFRVLTNSLGLDIHGSGSIMNLQADSISLSSDVKFTGQLTLATGHPVQTGPYSIILQDGASVLNEGPTQYINGNLSRQIPLGQNTFAFPVGTSTTYSPVSVFFSGVQTPGYLRIHSTDGDHPQIASSAIDAAKSINKYWTIENSGIDFTSSSNSANVTFNWASIDKDSPINLLNLSLASYNSPDWTVLTPGNLSSGDSVSAMSVTSFGEFQIGEPVCVSSHEYRTTMSGNWNDPGVWELYDGCNWVSGFAPDSQSVTVTIQSGHTIIMNNEIVLAQDINVDNGGSLEITNSSLFVSSSLNVISGGNLQTSNAAIFIPASAMLSCYGHLLVTQSSVVTCDGQIDISGGTGVCDLEGDVIFSGNGTLKNWSSSIVNINGAGVLHFSDGFNYNNSGICNWDGSETISINGGVTNNSVMNWMGSGTMTNEGTSSPYLSGSGTINKTGTGTIIIANDLGVNFGPVNIHSGAIEIITNVYCSFDNSLTIDSGASLIGTNLIYVWGGLTNNGSIECPTTFFPGSLIPIHGTGTIRDLTADAIIFGGDLRITEQLSLTNVLHTGGNKVILENGAVILNASPSQFIDGNVSQYIPVGQGTFAFPIGTGTYSPVSVYFSGVQTPGYLTVHSTNADHPEILSSNINPDKSINKYWTIENNGIDFTTGPNYASVNFSWDPADRDNTIDLFNISIAAYNSPSWAPVVPVNLFGTDSIIAMSVSSFGEYQIGEVNCLATNEYRMWPLLVP
ncbi:MAG: hypothetical protein IPP51_11040 [Bacteroidetes bacterium]|nr:hypothetical protein [Bacteroidota bacterium]